MAVWHDSISITVEIAFDTDPLAVTPTWTDVTAYVREVSDVFRGTTSEYSDLAPGTCTVVLDNRDNRFDPDNGSSPYSPDVLPMKRIKITWALGASSGLIFTGFVLGWPQDELQAADAVSTITCVDGSQFTNNDTLTASAYAAEVLADDPTFYVSGQDVNDGLRDQIQGFPLALTTGVEPTTVTHAYPIGEPNALSTSSASIYAATATQVADTAAPKAMDVWVKSDPATPGAGTQQFNFLLRVNSTDRLNIQIQGLQTVYIGYSNTTDNKRHDGGSTLLDYGPVTEWSHLAIRADTTNLFLYINGTLVLTQALSVGTFSGTDGVNLVWEAADGETDAPEWAHLAYYDTDIGATRIQDHYLAGRFAYGHPYGETVGTRLGRVLDQVNWPTGLRDIDVVSGIVGTYRPDEKRALEYARECVDGEQGLLYFNIDGELAFRDRNSILTATSAATFTDDGNAGDVEYLDVKRDGNNVDTIRNIVSFSYADVGGITRRDATSITAYGEAYEAVSSPALPNGRAATNMAAYLLRLKKDPDSRISALTVAVRVGGGDNEAEKILERDLGDVITVERTPVGAGAQVSKKVQIRGIQHRIDENQWYVTFYLSPTPEDNQTAPYLTLNDATYGKIGVTAGNLIPA